MENRERLELSTYRVKAGYSAFELAVLDDRRYAAERQRNTSAG